MHRTWWLVAASWLAACSAQVSGEGAEVGATAAQAAPLRTEDVSRWEQRGEWEGELEAVVVDSPSLRELRTDYFVTVAHQRHRLFFAGRTPEGLRGGETLKLRGRRVGHSLIAEDVQVGKRALEVVCGTTGAQRAVVILAAFPGMAQPAVTKQQVRDVFFSAAHRSLNDYWQEVSGGRTSASGDVVGWYALDRAYGCNEADAMRDAALRAADADVDFTKYNRVFIIHPTPQNGCDYAGLGTLSCNTLSTQDGPVMASTAWLLAGYMGNLDQGVMLATHEAGHNLTLNHANSRDFGTEALGPVGAPGTLTEYGDDFSTMGRWNLGHYAAPHKQRIGWMDPGAVVEVNGTDGTFTLAPSETSGGLKALKVRRGTGGNGWLWLEYRQPTGHYDGALASQPFGGALVHYEDASVVDGYTHLLDFSPGTASWDDPALPVGTTWTDPYSNLSVTVQSATSAGLTVSVHFTPVSCVPAPPDVQVMRMQDTSWPGGQPDFQVTMTNRDTSGCANSTFQVASLVPSGWGFDPLPSQVTLAPGNVAYLDLQTYAPYSTALGTYSVGVSVTRGGQSVQATDSVEIAERCVQALPTVSFSPGTVTAAPGTEATFSVTVANHDSASCNWVWYDFLTELPAGWDTTFSDYGVNLPPGGSYTFTMSKTVPAGAHGSYAADVQISLDGVGVQTVGTATIVVP